MVGIAPIETSIIFAAYSFVGRTGLLEAYVNSSAEVTTLQTWSAHGSCVSAGSNGELAFVAFTQGSAGPLLEIGAGGILGPLISEESCVAAIAPGADETCWAIAGQVKCAAISNGSPVTVSSVSSSISALARYASGNLIFADYRGVHVVTPAGAVVWESHLQNGVDGLVAVGERAFGVDSSAGTIASYPERPGSPSPMIVLSGEGTPALLTTDGTSLFWVDRDSSTIRAVDIAAL